jgi:hypothetical protein
VLSSIQFHDQPSRTAGKISDVRTDRPLPHESHTQSGASQPGPEPTLRFCRFAPHLARASRDFVNHPAIQPESIALRNSLPSPGSLTLADLSQGRGDLAYSTTIRSIGQRSSRRFRASRA